MKYKFTKNFLLCLTNEFNLLYIRNNLITSNKFTRKDSKLYNDFKALITRHSHII